MVVIQYKETLTNSVYCSQDLRFVHLPGGNLCMAPRGRGPLAQSLEIGRHTIAKPSFRQAALALESLVRPLAA